LYRQTIGSAFTAAANTCFCGCPANHSSHLRDRAEISEKYFHRKVRRTEEGKSVVRLPPAGLVLRCAPNGAASNQNLLIF
jgi:hypothetical protein